MAISVQQTVTRHRKWDSLHVPSADTGLIFVARANLIARTRTRGRILLRMYSWKRQKPQQ